MRKREFFGFVCGVLFSFMMSFTNVFADNFSKIINVITGINVYVNGNKLPNVNQNGNPVAFIYNGTSYVNASMLARGLNQNISWDSANRNLIIGSINLNSSYQSQSQGYSLLDVCKPYQVGRNYSTPEQITISGKKYTKGFILGADYNTDSGWALYNLERKFNVFSFDIGHIDGAKMLNGKLKIYLDGELSQTIDLMMDMIPKHYDIPLNNSSQMKLEISLNHDVKHGESTFQWSTVGICYGFFNAKLQ